MAPPVLEPLRIALRGRNAWKISHHWHTFQSSIEAGPGVIEFLGDDGRPGQATTVGRGGCGDGEAAC
ncbi:hypothetical protein FOXYSP1_19295 [Fusarium oxysporum f. sp. phaseoli]